MRSRSRWPTSTEISAESRSATIDRPGLLAAVTGVLARRRIDIVDAAAVTWPDGAVVESYTVRTVDPDTVVLRTEADLEAEIQRAVREPATGEAVPDLEIDFDSDASPWHTRCEVRGADRPGLLHAVTVGFLAAGVTVHSARIETVGGIVIDRFDLSDSAGAKLDSARRQAVRQAIWSGTGPGDRAGGRRRRLRRPPVRI